MLYDFIQANKLMRLAFVQKSLSSTTAYSIHLASFISYSSYVFQHAHRSQRVSSYACLDLLIFEVLLSDLDVARQICSADNVGPVRLCRQKAPMLPLTKGDRSLAGALLDAITGGLSHNLRRRLDVELYSYIYTETTSDCSADTYHSLFLSTLTRLITYFSITRTKLGQFFHLLPCLRPPLTLSQAHNYAPLTTSLLTILRFAATHAITLCTSPGIELLIKHLLTLLAILITTGEAFLPTDAAYDDMLYKVFEASDTFSDLRAAYPAIFATSAAVNNFDTAHSKPTASTQLEVLLAVVARCKTLLAETNNGKGISASAGPKEVGKVLRAGYEGLQKVIEEHTGGNGKGGREMKEPYRESEWRGLVKRIGRQVVIDARAAVV
jgi:hypothetical protein